MINEPNKYAWGIAFVTFQTKKIADLVETKWGYSMSFSLSNITKLFQSNKKYIYHRNGSSHSTDIKVLRAPNPNDIIWPNLGMSWSSLITRTLTTYFVTAILLGLSFGALVGLKVLQFGMTQNTDNSSSGTFKFRAVSVCISLVITIINQVLGRSIKALTHTERHSTLTAYFQSLVIKVVAVRSVWHSHNSLTRTSSSSSSTSSSSRAVQLFGRKVCSLCNNRCLTYWRMVRVGCFGILGTHDEVPQPRSIVQQLQEKFSRK